MDTHSPQTFPALHTTSLYSALRFGWAKAGRATASVQSTFVASEQVDRRNKPCISEIEHVIARARAANAADPGRGNFIVVGRIGSSSKFSSTEVESAIAERKALLREGLEGWDVDEIIRLVDCRFFESHGHIPWGEIEAVDFFQGLGASKAILIKAAAGYLAGLPPYSFYTFSRGILRQHLRSIGPRNAESRVAEMDYRVLRVCINARLLAERHAEYLSDAQRDEMLSSDLGF